MIVTELNIHQADFQAGCTILVNKPVEWTSFDVVNKIRGTLRHVFSYKKIKVGHAGTLDPLATGLLVICTGKKTKELAQFLNDIKVYVGKMVLGATTASYDRETPIEKTFSTDGITKKDLMQAREAFLGVIDQVPPTYSAIKKQGIPLYKYARKGTPVTVDPRQVEVFEFDLLNFTPPEIDFKVRCSKGTYIRTLIHDYGKALSVGAYLNELVRISSGSFELSLAWKLDTLIQYLESLKRIS